jgi:hypothetical protein
VVEGGNNTKTAKHVDDRPQSPRMRKTPVFHWPAPIGMTVPARFASTLLETPKRLFWPIL